MHAPRVTPRKHPRLRTAVRKTVKWGGAVATVFLLLAWIGSGWCSVPQFIPGTRIAAISAGLFTYVDVSSQSGDFGIAWPSAPAGKYHLYWGFGAGTIGSLRALSVPLWAPSLLSLFVTALAWRADSLSRRRARVGLCPACGYDRAGIAMSSVCPECGSAAASNAGV